MKSLNDIAKNILQEQNIGNKKRFDSFRIKTDTWLRNKLQSITKIPLSNPQTEYNNYNGYQTTFEKIISIPNTFWVSRFLVIGWTIKPTENYPIISVFYYFKNENDQPSTSELKWKFPFLQDFQLTNIKNKFELRGDRFQFHSKQELGTLNQKFRISWKELISKAKFSTKEIIKFVKQNYASKRVQNKAQFVSTIYDDLKQFANKFGSYDKDDIEKFGNRVEFGVRHLGNWIDDEQDSAEYDDPDSDMYDPSWREDNDNRIWAPGEYKKYFKIFNEWAKTKSWYKKVKLGLGTGEKDWCYFSIRLK